MHRQDTTPAAYFWSKVHVVPGPGCWEWTAACDRDGYGYFSSRRIPGSQRATHWMYWFMYGEWPSGWMLHHCDNPPCVRPAHLYCGTARENAADTTRRGRWRPRAGDGHGLHLHPERAPQGEQQHSSKLTEADVRAMRAAYSAGGVTYRQLAARYGIHEMNVGYIIRRQLWRHLP